MFSIPGVYRIGIIDETDADTGNVQGTNGNNGEADEELTSTDFNSGLSSQRSIRIAQPSLSVTFDTYNGQIYLPQEFEFNGTSIGPDEVLFVAGDSRGGTLATGITVDDDDEFDEEISLLNFDPAGTVPGPSNALGSRSMVPGSGSVAVFSPGKDGVFGDGRIETAPDVPGVFGANPKATLDNLAKSINLEHRDGRDPSQHRAELLEDTVEDTGSDDLVQSVEVRFTDDAQTSIRDIVPANYSNVTGVHKIEAGETAIVRGLTNLKPDENTIVVQAIEGPDNNKISVNSTDMWQQDGVWSVSIDVPSDVTPGNYTIQADSGEASDQVDIQIVADGQRGPIQASNPAELRNQIEELQNQVDQLQQENSNLQNQVNKLQNTTESLRQERNRLKQQLQNQTNNNGTGGGGGQGQPGFTAVVAVLAIIAVALLALRRREE
ncbi:MAG: PGF-CTERM sorting domain-containing protein [Halobacteria archaeon]|nr:PGF-CTERM sorting domain-containing protein [Halobacteria archaeon]